MTKNGVMKIEGIIHSEPPRLLVLFDKGQEEIVRVVADVVGQSYGIVGKLEDAAGRTEDGVVGLENGFILNPELLRRVRRTVITTHAIDEQDLRDEQLTAFCDYEYLYSSKRFSRRTVARYLGFILGQIKPHNDLKKKTRTTLLSTTFPDIRAALPNLDILSVGADSVELRVDLLKEDQRDEMVAAVPSLKYVGEQVMLLRQRTELPIIFTTRCTKENGRFPMDDPMLFYQYLHKAIQWGCEYVDVELWLPEEVRHKLAAEKRNSRIISAWHDFSGHFKWTSDEAHQLFRDGAAYGDIVKMIAFVNTMEANYELEYFRSTVQSMYQHPPFSGLNMGPIGQLSRTLNKVFTPITHPLLPMIAAPGQLSAAEINSMLHSMGHLHRLDVHAVGNVRTSGQAMFLEKCLNELSLPHQLRCMECLPQGTIERIVNQANFGGAYLNPPLPSSKASYLPNVTEAAATIGQVDTIVVRSTADGRSLLCDNATWKGIRATLTRDVVPSAYGQRPALILANAEPPAAAAIYALADLGIGPIYTIGFKANGLHGVHLQQFRGAEDMKKVKEPFVIISALPPEKSHIVSPLLKHYSNTVRALRRPGRVFLDLANGIHGKGDSVATAKELGYRSYGIATVNASTMVETLRLLLGFNVGVDFVKLASDAIPKKRGPKTDVLEALLKRVNGLEKRLKDEKTTDLPINGPSGEAAHSSQEPDMVEEASPLEHTTSDEQPTQERQPQLMPAHFVAPRAREPIAFTDALLDTYFARLHNKPYYVLDEPNTRQRLQDGQLPLFLINAIHAVSIRYVPHLSGGHSGAVRSSQEYAKQSRSDIDVDEPSIDHLQALLLLAMASFQSGKGKKSYMLLSHAISMAFALDLHREVPLHLRFAAIEREGRRKLFWTCYLMDRFTTSGSKRPPLISDESISLRYPAWLPPGSQRFVDGNYFPNGSTLSHASGISSAAQGSAAMLVEIVRILGATNRYLASGGVKGDSHFPWHAQSTLSRIRSDLDNWAASTQDAFASLDALFGQVDSVSLVLSKLIYHLVHCLLYRPFLPVDLAELSGNSQNQSWQIEATNLCFMHANAIAELLDIGKNTGIIYWPSFVGFCVCTAGTIHVHGAHYMAPEEGDVFSNSANFLSREMAQLADLGFLWAGVQHQRETLQTAYASHSRLVQSLACSPMRFSPVFQMEDFFDRYPGSYIDGAHITFTDIIPDSSLDSPSAYHNVPQGGNMWTSQAYMDQTAPYQPVVPSQYMTKNRMPSTSRSTKRRRTTNGSSYPYPTPTSEAHPNPFDQQDRSLSQTSSHHQAGIQEVEPTQQASEANNVEQAQNPTLAGGIFSPSFTFSPMTQNMVMQSTNHERYDPFFGVKNSATDHPTPSGFSASSQSAHAAEATDNDPFLSLLEQLAENDGSGGPNDLNYFLSAQDSAAFGETA
ncbi:hypothetical protein LTR37_002224 [Vermiconidia calcicola]|uniref:Uncharacterized protein n=1 Tax=Vermiconidia calcicola TaxID=1690605 RepID=A0ACC3NT28_9PEZI|nr:hypothetical protein LTR37_002224 [Vermiconidia calcicola]